MRVVTILVLFLQLYVTSTVKVTKGPYYSIPVGSRRCHNPQMPFEKNASLSFQVELYIDKNNITKIRGNLTILRPKSNIDVKLRARRYKYEDGGWKLSYMMQSNGCRGLMISSLLFMYGIKYNKKNCRVPKGVHSFSNIDTNHLEHMWYKQREYELALWKSELYSSSGTMICCEFVTLVVPI